MQREEIRKKREAAQILLTFFRCVSMKRVLNCDNRDHLNFFRLYDGCLMDVAVISWWKIFGDYEEDSHWKNLCGPNIAGDLYKSCGNDEAFQRLWSDVKTYRHKYIAHHEYDQETRPRQHILLSRLWKPASVAYKKIFDDLWSEGATAGLPRPHNLTGDNLARQEAQWGHIVAAARTATMHFKDAPEQESPKLSGPIECSGRSFT